MKFMRQYLLSLLLTFVMVSGAYAAADLGNTAVISPTDASNGSGTCPSWLGSAAPSTIDDAGRCLQGAIAREWQNRSFAVTSSGSADAYVVAYTVAPAAYRTGQVYSFITNFTVGGTATVNINSLGAKTIKKDVAGTLTALASGDMSSGQFVMLAYNGTDMIWVNWQGATGYAVGGTDVAISDGGTGQSTATAAFDALAPTTTQGDIIYHNGTDNVRLGPGTSGQFLKTNGAGANPAWASGSGVFPHITVLTSGTSHTTNAATTYATVEVIGAGGDGGTGATGAGDGGGGGGGGGGYAKKNYVLAGSTAYTIAVGTTAGASSTFTDGVTLITGSGGSVGGAGGAESGGTGGTGGTGTNGDINLSGGAGSPGGLGDTTAGSTTGGTGGAPGGGMGNGGIGGYGDVNNARAGGNGALYGGGGGGGNGRVTAGGAGGTFAAGAVIITEYY